MEVLIEGLRDAEGLIRLPCTFRGRRKNRQEDGVVENGRRHGRGFTLWFTGLSGAGKTTMSEIVEKELRHRFGKVEVLDGDIVRTNLSKGLGFSREDRDTNILRIGFVAELLTRNGVGVIVSAISPFKEARERVRRNIGEDFIEVFVDALWRCAPSAT